MTQTSSTSPNPTPSEVWEEIQFKDDPAVEILLSLTRGFSIPHGTWKFWAGTIRVKSKPGDLYSFTVSHDLVKKNMVYLLAVPPGHAAKSWADKAPRLKTTRKWKEHVLFELASEFLKYIDEEFDT